MDRDALEIKDGPPLEEVLQKVRAAGPAKEKLSRLGVVLARAMAAKMQQQQKDDEA